MGKGLHLQENVRHHVVVMKNEKMITGDIKPVRYRDMILEQIKEEIR